MGCDIHILVEQKNQETNEWEPMEGSFKKESDDGEDYIVVGPYESKFYFGRDYDSFAMLADVRNGSGFAGCDTGDGYEVIDEPRGVPTDASKLYLEYVEQWRGDGHSYSYFYLKELKELFTNGYFDKKTKSRGYVSLNELKRMYEENDKQPDSWCGNVSGRGVLKVDREKGLEILDSISKGRKLEPEESYYVQVEWENTYREDGKNLVKYIEMLTEIEIEKNLCHNCIRICFFFDN